MRVREREREREASSAKGWASGCLVTTCSVRGQRSTSRRNQSGPFSQVAPARLACASERTNALVLPSRAQQQRHQQQHQHAPSFRLPSETLTLRQSDTDDFIGRPPAPTSSPMTATGQPFRKGSGCLRGQFVVEFVVVVLAGVGTGHAAQ